MRKGLQFLPELFVNRYIEWKRSTYQDNKNWYNKISKAQNPTTMVISCCDSRVHVTSIFGANTGEFFIHRNIANLIPPYNPNGDHHGTSAAIEYAVKSLKVSNIIVLGHSNCGGIHNGYKLCSNQYSAQNLIFVKKWLSILKPAYNKLPTDKSENEKINLLEKESIKVSLDHLIEFPFVNEVISSHKLFVHGLWHDIGAGNLETLDPNTMKFARI